MGGYRTDPDTGQTVFVSGEDAPAERHSAGSPMQDPGWVEHFLNGPTTEQPFRSVERPTCDRSSRAYRRRSRRRG